MTSNFNEHLASITENNYIKENLDLDKFYGKDQWDRDCKLNNKNLSDMNPIFKYMSFEVIWATKITFGNSSM